MRLPAHSCGEDEPHHKQKGEIEERVRIFLKMSVCGELWKFLCGHFKRTYSKNTFIFKGFRMRFLRLVCWLIG